MLIYETVKKENILHVQTGDGNIVNVTDDWYSTSAGGIYSDIKGHKL